MSTSPQSPPVMVIKDVDDHGTHYRTALVWCPGCDALHAMSLGPTAPAWSFDGNMEAPTFAPSILCHSPRCHSFIERGQWRFLADCDHALAEQTVPMVELPEWVQS
jgi:hypothetical protein